MPTSDLLNKNKDQSKGANRMLELFEPIVDSSLAKTSFFAKNKDWLRSKFGLVPESGKNGGSGFRSIMKKSLHLSN